MHPIRLAALWNAGLLERKVFLSTTSSSTDPQLVRKTSSQADLDSVSYHLDPLTSDFLVSVGEKQPTILKWRILTTTGDLERVSAVALPKLPIAISNTDLKVAPDTKFCPGLGE